MSNKKHDKAKEILASGRGEVVEHGLRKSERAIKRPRTIHKCRECGKLFLDKRKMPGHERRHAQDYLDRQETIEVIAGNIEILLEQRGWKQADLARAVGASAATVNGWYMRRHPPSVHYYLRLSELSTKLFPHIVSRRALALPKGTTPRWQPAEWWEDNVRDQISAEISKLRKHLKEKESDVIIPREIFSLWMGRGDSLPTLRTLVKLAKAIDVPLSELLRRCGL